MDGSEKYRTYWYENADGDVEVLEISASSIPPVKLNMPTTQGLVESYILIDEKYDDFSSICDD